MPDTPLEAARLRRVAHELRRTDAEPPRRDTAGRMPKLRAATSLGRADIGQ